MSIMLAGSAIKTKLLHRKKRLYVQLAWKSYYTLKTRARRYHSRRNCWHTDPASEMRVHLREQGVLRCCLSQGFHYITTFNNCNGQFVAVHLRKASSNSLKDHDRQSPPTCVTSSLRRSSDFLTMT